MVVRYSAAAIGMSLVALAAAPGDAAAEAVQISFWNHLRPDSIRGYVYKAHDPVYVPSNEERSFHIGFTVPTTAYYDGAITTNTDPQTTICTLFLEIEYRSTADWSCRPSVRQSHDPNIQCEADIVHAARTCRVIFAVSHK